MLTAEELLHTSIQDKRVELVRGVLVVREPPGYQHGRVMVELCLVLGTHIKETGAGQLVTGDTGFHLARDPDTVRGPDLAFISCERAPDPHTPGFPFLAPDLVVEVLSPSDRPGEVLAKVGDWLDAGVRIVWVIDPARRVARVYRADGSETIVSEDERLEGEAILPGFRCLLQSIL